MHDILPPKSLFEFQTWFAHHLTSPLGEVDGSNIPVYSPQLIEEIRGKDCAKLSLSSKRGWESTQQYWWEDSYHLARTLPKPCAPFWLRRIEPQDFRALSYE